jgi:low affinity Fe/Cu permease
MEKLLRKKLSQLATLISNPYTFVCALIGSIVWVVYGALNHFPDTWFKITPLVISFFTFIIVFVVEFSEETDTRAMQRKLNAIIDAFPEIKDVTDTEKKLRGEK